MDGNCNVESIIYKAEVNSQTTKETYIGLCDTVQGITQAHFAMNCVETQLNLANMCGTLKIKTFNTTPNGVK